MSPPQRKPFRGCCVPWTPDDEQIRAAAARHLHRVAATAGEHVMSDSSDLTEALKARGLMAAASGRSVRAWRPAAPDDAILVCPGWAAGGAALWSWQHGGTAGSHPRGDIPGAADAVAAFLADDPP
jgi:hypothetical protein